VREVHHSDLFKAAQEFVETFYPALNNPKARVSISSFYLKPTLKSPQKPDISLNGNIIEDPAEVQNIFEKQISKAHYEVQSFDCNVINPNYNVGMDDAGLGPDKDGKKMSILLMVSGSVRYWKNSEDGENRGFTETFVLIPKWEAHSPKAPKGLKRWLIQSQNFRLVL
jgi:NTF2-related export protein 1/2